MAEWWEKNKKKIPMTREEFCEILLFYVYKCPVQQKDGHKVTPRAKTFEECGVIDVKLTRLLHLMKQKIKHKECFICCKNEKEILLNERKLTQHYDLENHVEFVLYVENKELKKTRSVFYAIRNALAHGTFSVVESKNDEKHYYIQTENRTGIKSRMCLNEKTLLKWIDLTQKMMSGKCL